MAQDLLLENPCSSTMVIIINVICLLLVEVFWSCCSLFCYWKTTMEGIKKDSKCTVKMKKNDTILRSLTVIKLSISRYYNQAFRSV